MEILPSDVLNEIFDYFESIYFLRGISKMFKEYIDTILEEKGNKLIITKEMIINYLLKTPRYFEVVLIYTDPEDSKPWPAGSNAMYATITIVFEKYNLATKKGIYNLVRFGCEKQLSRSDILAIYNSKFKIYFPHEWVYSKDNYTYTYIVLPSPSMIENFLYKYVFADKEKLNRVLKNILKYYVNKIKNCEFPLEYENKVIHEYSELFDSISV